MTTPKEIRRLNTLRGIAALVVVVSHYTNQSGIWGDLLGRGAGHLGVMLFFLLSGFLMSHLYFGLPADGVNLRKYAVARGARVLPLYVAVCVMSFVLVHWGSKHYRHLLYPIDTTGLLASHLLFLYGMSVLWTIPPEIHFYLLFALGWRLFQTRLRKAMPLLVALALGAALFWGGDPQEIHAGGLIILPSITQALPLFLIGALLGRAYQRIDRLERFRHRAFEAALLLLPLLFPKVIARFTGNEPGTWGNPLMELGVAAIFFCIVFLVPEGSWVLENRVGDFYGKISYSLYLLHLPVLEFMARRGGAVGFRWLVIFTAVATVFAYLSFLLIEAPSRQFLRRILSARAKFG